MRKPAPAEIQAERDQATKDYINDLQAVRDRTEKLRAERLARAGRPAPDAAKPKPNMPKPKTPASRRTKTKGLTKT